MKYLVVLCDGMADVPNIALSGKTPMECANKPHMDFLAKKSEVGMCRTVANGLKPGSDVANLSVLGYDPTVSYTGRSPLEAASIGIDLKDTDVTLRCNIVTLSDEENYEDKRMVDYCAGDISTAEAKKIIQTVEEKLGNDIYKFYSGVSYRHCLVVDNGTTELGNMTPPHDISGKVIGEYLSDSENAKPLIELMKKSYNILKDHPVNLERRAQGKNEANSIWLWGEGTKPQMENFREKNGVTGCIVSAVDLLKGIAICAGMKAPNVKGATGYLDTDFEGKTNAGIQAFKEGYDLVYLHFEAPDECGHRGEIENKVKAIEAIDARALRPMIEYLDGCGEDYKILIMPDHPTPLDIKTHTSNPVPYMIYDSKNTKEGVDSFTEENARLAGNFVEHGPEIMEKLLKK
ncbi:MAG: cofactor-independent phosphoglycerate mutase [Clostridia bacterium]|nr:cofactor-independent phosphoglycerate mutase [Clostridia bacterium]MEE1184761.1 cofactor-independent phosphoglycerate mutase [Acutalibacteraceae bacterium]